MLLLMVGPGGAKGGGRLASCSRKQQVNAMEKKVKKYILTSRSRSFPNKGSLTIAIFFEIFSLHYFCFGPTLYSGHQQHDQRAVLHSRYSSPIWPWTTQ